MKVYELKKDVLINEWLDSINASKTARCNYLFAMQAYTELIKKTLNELIEEAEAEKSNPSIKKRLRSIKRYLIEFRKHLPEKN